MNKFKAAIKGLYRHIQSDSLYRNSFFLLTSTMVLSVCGFFFWIIAARYFTASAIGISTTLLSVSAYITTIGLLGMDGGLLRFLPKPERRNVKINSSMTLILIFTFLATVAFLVIRSRVSSKFGFIGDSPLYVIGLLLIVALMSMDTIVNQIFVAYRSSKYVLFKSIIFSVLRLMLPIILVGAVTLGPFIANGIAIGVGVFFSLYILIHKYKYRPAFVLDRKSIKEMRSYSAVQYIASLSSNFTTVALPILVLNQLGASQAAYYYMATMLAKFLTVIPQTASKSLLVESSHDESILAHNVLKVAKQVLIILIPAIIGMIIFGRFILTFFGKSYSSEAGSFLAIMAISAIFGACNYVGDAVLNVQQRNKTFLFMNTLNTGIIFILSYIAVKNGLYGLGKAWLASQVITACVYLALFAKPLYSQFIKSTMRVNHE